MDNPFKKRATEYFNDPDSLISVLSPEPVRLFFREDTTALFDRLVTVVGTPGSGKTSIARLLEFDTLITLVRSANNSSEYNKFFDILNMSKVLIGNVPQLLGYRLPSSSDMRNIHELPYDESIKRALLFSLIQARAVLGWLRKLERVEVDLGEIRIIPSGYSDAAARVIKAGDPLAFRQHAREVEEKIFRIVTALIPPSPEALAGRDLGQTYEVFLNIDGIEIPPIPGVTQERISLKPLVILDDAHELHRMQYTAIEQWLKEKREIRVARWVMTRVDAINPEKLREVLAQEESPSIPGTTLNRDWILRLMQPQRGSSLKKEYYKAYEDIAKRYIDHMPSLRRVQFRNCLDIDKNSISLGQLNELEASVEHLKEVSHFSVARLDLITSWIPSDMDESMRLAVLRIMIYREMGRTPQTELFAEVESVEDEELPDPRKVTPALRQGAALQLYHKYGRPYYYGFDKLVDASGENIEQFIYLAGVLVDLIETRVIKGKPTKLDAREQNKALVTAAQKTIDGWNFPFSTEVRRLVNFIAERSLARTLEPNASLSQGANAFGIPLAEMTGLEQSSADFAQIIHYGIAYNAVSLFQGYRCKKREWCLFQLGPLPILANGLPFGKGGFCEGHLAELKASVQG